MTVLLMPPAVDDGRTTLPHWPVPLLATLYAALAAATGWGRPLPAALLVTAVLLVEPRVLRRAPEFAKVLNRAQLGTGARWLIRTSLLVASLAIHRGTTSTATWVLEGAVLFVVLARGAWLALVRRGRRSQRQQVRWQGFAVADALAGPAPVDEPGFLRSTPTTRDGVLILEWIVVIGVALTAVSGPWAAWAVAGSCLAGALLFLGRALRFERRGAKAAAAGLLPQVAEGLAGLSPEVVVHFSSPKSGSYALGVWLETLRRLDQRVVVVLREAHHLQALDLAGLPTVVLPAAQDVELARVPSMKVALYPTNVVKNNHMLRLPGIRHAFIGHGDSDKAGSYSPVSRVYDEIWVAGDAGRDRYLAAGEGVRPEQIRQVSRPQLGELSAGSIGADSGPARRPTVLYAPTWEGFYDQSDYCSVVDPGVRAVEALVASGRFRVLFKPHPASGERRADVVAAIERIEELLTKTPHERLPAAPEALYRGMREADVLISDVSSLLSDWLATGRPYLVTNPQRMQVDELRERFPTARGGAILDPGGDVLALVDEALGADEGAGRRAQLARYLLGPPTADPVQAFVDEVTDFVDRSQTRTRVAAVEAGGPR